MLFFEAQEKAKQKSKWLVIVFLVNAIVLSILNTVIIKFFLFDLKMINLKFFKLYQKKQDWSFAFNQYLENQTNFYELFKFYIYSIEFKIFFTNLLFFALLALYYLNKYYKGGAVAEELGGTRIDRKSTINETALTNKEKILLNIVEEMSIASGVQIPEVYVLKNESTINAFASGGSRNFFAISVTQGALDLLDRSELQAVVAHEFSHILNEDTVLNTQLTSVVMGFQIIYRTGLFLIRKSTLTGQNQKGRDRYFHFGGYTFFAIFILMAGFLGYFLSRFLQASISRQREFLADASSAQFTRYPESLAGALAKIAMGPGSSLFSSYKLEHSHIFFSNSHKSSKWTIPTSFGLWMETHPPISERIQRLLPKQNIDSTFDQAYEALQNLNYSKVEAIDLTKIKSIETVKKERAAASLTALENMSRLRHPDLNTTTTTKPSLSELSGIITSQGLNESHLQLEKLKPLEDSFSNETFAKSALLLALLHFQSGFEEISEIIKKENRDLIEKLDTLLKLIKDEPLLIETIFTLCIRTLKTTPPIHHEQILEVIRKFYTSDKKISLLEGLYLELVHAQLNLKNTRKSHGYFTLVEARQQMTLLLQKSDTISLGHLQEVIQSFKRSSRVSLLHHLDALWKLVSGSHQREIRALFLILSIPFPIQVQAQNSDENLSL